MTEKNLDQMLDYVIEYCAVTHLNWCDEEISSFKSKLYEIKREVYLN